jgi:hypothetical protein
MSLRFPCFLPAVSCLLSVAAISNLQAQSKPANIRTITTFTVKNDRAGDAAAAIKEYNAILKKAQWDKSYTIWRSNSGPVSLVRVDYHEKWADLDRQTAADPKLKEFQVDLARITTRINESFLSIDRVIDVVNPDMSTPPGSDIPKMVMVWTAHTKPGKMREVTALEKDEFVPAVKAAGIKNYSFAATRFGGPNGEIRAVTGIQNWAGFDEPNPIRKAMGDEKYRAFSEKMGALLEDYRYDIYRFDPELSYIPAK